MVWMGVVTIEYRSLLVRSWFAVCLTFPVLKKRVSEMTDLEGGGSEMDFKRQTPSRCN